MKKEKNCSDKTISTVEGGFKIRVFGDRAEAEKDSREERSGKVWEGISRE